jgi:LSD1 subclass zinc finger protein
MTKLICPSCKTVLKLPKPMAAGTKIKCPKCTTVFAVPAAETVTTAAVTPPTTTKAPPAKSAPVAAPPKVAPPPVAAVQKKEARATAAKPAPEDVPTLESADGKVRSRKRPSLAAYDVDPREGQKKSRALLIWGLTGGGVFLLLVAGGVMALVSASGRSPSTRATASKPGAIDDADRAARGYNTPEEAMDAYVKALRTKDVDLLKTAVVPATLLEFEGRVRELTGNGTKGLSPDAAWKRVLEKTYATEFPDNLHKRFPAEGTNVETARIVVLRGDAQGADLARYRQYTVWRRQGLWQVSGQIEGLSKDLPDDKYPWQKTKPVDPGPPAPNPTLDAEMKRALEGVKLVQIDVTVGGLPCTILAPEGSTVTAEGHGVGIKNGERFDLHINPGRLEMPVSREQWKKDEDYRLVELVIDEPERALRKTNRKIVKTETHFRFAVNLKLGHLDFRAEDNGYSRFNQSDCLLMMHCGSTVSLKPGYKPPASLEALAKDGIGIDRGEDGKTVRGVSFWDQPFTDSSVSLLLPYAGTLEFLNLNSCEITDQGLKPLAALTNLKSLTLPVRNPGRRLDGSGLVYLKGLNKLEDLHLDYTGVTDANLVHLKGLTGLRSLGLNGTPLTGAGFEHLKGLTGLKVLGLNSTPVTGDGFEHLKGLTNLESLHLSGSQVSDAGLKHLAGLTNLRDLPLGETQITDAGLEHLKGLTKLRSLELNGTQVTGPGFMHLTGL